MTRGFRLFWAGQTASLVGSQVTIIALPLVAVLELRSSELLVAGLYAASFLPYLLVGLHAGALVDRLDRRNVMLACDLGRLLLLSAIPVLAVLSLLNGLVLLIVAFGTGVCTVVFEIAAQAYVPDIVSRTSLQAANARLEISRSGAQVLGPAIGGVLVQALGAAVAVFADALSFLASAVLLTFAPPTGVPRRRDDGSERVLHQIREGLSFVWRAIMLRRLVVSYCICAFSIGLYQAIAIVYMSDTLRLSPGEIGLVYTIGNVGFIGGAAASRRVAKTVGLGRTIVLSVVLSGIAMMWIGLTPASVALPWLVAGQLMATFAIPIYNVNAISVRQVLTPAPLLGRVSSVSRTFGRGFVPVAAVLGGAIAMTVGPRTAVVVASVFGLVAAVPTTLGHLPGLRSLDEIAEIQAGPE